MLVSALTWDLNCFGSMHHRVSAKEAQRIGLDNRTVAAFAITETKRAAASVWELKDAVCNKLAAQFGFG